MGNGGSAVKVCADHQGGINWLSLSPDGQRLLTGSEDGTARLWSTADSQCHGHFQGRRSDLLLIASLTLRVTWVPLIVSFSRCSFYRTSWPGTLRRNLVE